MSENYKIVTAEEWKAMFALSKAASECADGTCVVPQTPQYKEFLKEETNEAHA